MNEQRTRTVGILIFDEVEVLDFCGPFEVFSMARRLNSRYGDEHRLFKVVTIAEEQRTLTCRGGLLVQPHHDIDGHPPLDVLVVPGGAGVRGILENERLLGWIEAQASQVDVATSVCTGALLLARTGLLDGRRATTHWASLDRLREHHPAVDVVAGVRFVDEGRIVTSAGVSAGIDMALHLVGRFHGDGVAEQTARTMEYDRWDEQRSGNSTVNQRRQT